MEILRQTATLPTYLEWKEKMIGFTQLLQQLEIEFNTLYNQYTKEEYKKFENVTTETFEKIGQYTSLYPKKLAKYLSAQLPNDKAEIKASVMFDVGIYDLTVYCKKGNVDIIKIEFEQLKFVLFCGTLIPRLRLLMKSTNEVAKEETMRDIYIHSRENLNLEPPLHTDIDTINIQLQLDSTKQKEIDKYLDDVPLPSYDDYVEYMKTSAENFEKSLQDFQSPSTSTTSTTPQKDVVSVECIKNRKGKKKYILSDSGIEVREQDVMKKIKNGKYKLINKKE